MEQNPIADALIERAAPITWGCLPAEIVLKCWEDPAYAERLRQFPKETLAGAGIEIDGRLDVQIAQNSATVLHLVIPHCPAPLRQADPAQLTPDKW